jgi:CO/xanthine dehydrogenase Mo-binding subunit
LVEVTTPDTGLVPDSGPTVASRTAMIVGKLVEDAAKELRRRIGDGDFVEACAAYLARHGELKCLAHYQPPPEVYWDDETYTGEAYAAYAWAVYVAEVTVDTITYETQVDDFVAVQEVGRVLNPVLAAGQIEGGVAQAIGYALYENVSWREGRMANSQMTNYIIPTSADMPPVRVVFEEIPFEHGPGGAKGIGELPMDGPAPAVVNAIEHATGLSFTRIPVLPEDLMHAA